MKNLKIGDIEKKEKENSDLNKCTSFSYISVNLFLSDPKLQAWFTKLMIEKKTKFQHFGDPSNTYHVLIFF